MHTFFVEKGADGAFRLTDEEGRHARRVLRLEDGEEICALDGFGHRWTAVLGKGDAIRLAEPLPDNEPAIRLTVYQGLLKADKLEWVVQKLTELGASSIVPVIMRRSVSREGSRREDRMKRIAREAVKQCRRARVPEVAENLGWKGALERMRGHELLIVPWEEQLVARISDLRAAYPDARDIAVVIGPEGGIAPEEIEEMRALGGKCVTMGTRILRAETAAIASAASVMTLWGEL